MFNETQGLRLALTACLEHSGPLEPHFCEIKRLLNAFTDHIIVAKQDLFSSMCEAPTVLFIWPKYGLYERIIFVIASL